MASEGADDKGIDFKNDGVARASLADPSMTAGHFDDDAILLALNNGRLFAVGAICTHYGAPLVDGILVGDTVRCPWHHACFALETGEAIRTPALDPVECWTVEERDGKVYITGHRESDSDEQNKTARPETGQALPQKVVIIGGGAAGNAAAEMLRRDGYGGSIAMITSDPVLPYDRPALSKELLAGQMEADQILLRDQRFYMDHDIEIVRDEVLRIDVAGKRVELKEGEAREYDALLLATGAEPIALKIPGGDLPHVHLLRTMADARQILREVEKAKKVVVIGASFIGLEAAASLREHDLEVHVVAPDELPLGSKMGKEIGELVKSLHEEHGVIFHLGHKPKSISETEVKLDNGEKLPADLVVVGIGVRPRLDLAKAAGLNCDNGILVDKYLKTSADGIYAAGDIARWPDKITGKNIRVEHWVVAESHGQNVAKNIMGSNEPFTRAPFFWSQHYDFSIRYVGHAEKWDDVSITGDVSNREFSVAYHKQGKTVAVASVSQDKKNLRAELAMEAADEAKLTQVLQD